MARELGADAHRLLIRRTDVTDEADVVGLIAEAEAFSPITLLVANAGIASHCPTLALDAHPDGPCTCCLR
jgi:NAD(P)-dependent dehydrogenase (short-subunit alcohol dehydrogenase family)